MSWLSVFFKRDSVRAILDIGKKILAMFLGRLAEDLQRVAWEEVKKAQLTTGSGVQKARSAFEGIRARLPEISDSQINLALEIAVAAIKSGSLDR